MRLSRRSALVAEVDRVAEARLEFTGPARVSSFAVRVPVRVLRFGGLLLREPARPDLPGGRSSPQGAIVEATVRVWQPRGPDEDGLDESAYLRRQSIHVVLTADAYRVGGCRGRRGGLGGVVDELRSAIARSLAPG